MSWKHETKTEKKIWADAHRLTGSFYLLPTIGIGRFELHGWSCTWVSFVWLFWDAGFEVERRRMDVSSWEEEA